MSFKGVLTEVLDAKTVSDPLDIRNNSIGKISVGAKSNVVKKDTLRRVQYSTLQDIAEVLEHTFGPRGTNTVFLKGSDATTLTVNYTKDGRKCLEHLLYNNPIELSIQTQLKDIVTHVDKEVGDGTTSATLLSNAIFQQLCADEVNDKSGYTNPYATNRDFEKAVDLIKANIILHRREFTLDDVYDIAYTSTNGNEDVARELYNIYKEYGLDVYIDTTIANTEESIVKVYDGLTLDEGYSDSAYINTTTGKASIRNAKVYAFADPVDTTELVPLLEKIIYKNAMLPILNPDEYDYEPIPTVIMAPKISRDLSEMIGKLVDLLYSYDSQNLKTQKPPILIVTNLLGGNMDKFIDLSRLCGCKLIKKYIDPHLQEEAIKKGEAPTVDNIDDFAGECELVEADNRMTKFINPKCMYEKNPDGSDRLDENGDPIPTATFANMLEWLASELEAAELNGEDDKTKFQLRQRLQSLKANLVEYAVGGVSISDRDAVKDLVEDAVKSCRSAAMSGVGYGANFEGLRASLEIASDNNVPKNIRKMAFIIAKAYVDVARVLYSTVDKDPDEVITETLEKGEPYNIRTESYDSKVITSINTDVYILDAISKIVTLMFGCDQCLLQVPALNRYQ
jgi:chaperonin GroEL (HSP60 family)